MTIAVGQLRHKVTVQHNVLDGVDRNAYNENDTTTEGWTVISGGDIHASILPLSGTELIEAQQIAAEVTHRVTVRYHSGIDATMRIKHGDRILYIKGIHNVDERDRWLDLMCVERP